MNEFARDLLIEQLARLRFACAALQGVEPKDIRLDDLAPGMSAGFRKQAHQDYLELISQKTTGQK